MQWFKIRITIIGKALDRPWAKWPLLIWVVLGSWDLFVAQFFPPELAETMPRVYDVLNAMTGWFPWWVWSLIGMGMITTIAIEYAIRRDQNAKPVNSAGGLSLNEAFLYFSDRDDRKGLADLKSKISDSSILAVPLMGTPTPLEQFKRLQDRMFKEFWSKLKIGDLIATGIVEGNKNRIIIPSSHWDFLKMDFKLSSAEGGGFQYSNIRIVQG